MVQEKRRRFPWKTLLVAAGMLLGVTLAYCLWCRWAADRHWNAMEERVRLSLDHERGAPFERPLLRGEPMAGEAWDEYLASLTPLCAISPFARELENAREYLEGKPDYDRTKLLALLNTYRSSIDALRRGARRKAGPCPLMNAAGGPTGSPAWSDSLKLGRLALCQARIFADEGRPCEASDLLLDLAQFSQDLSSGTRLSFEWTSNSILGSSLDELRPLILSGTLDEKELRTIEVALNVMDESVLNTAYVEPANVARLGQQFLRSPNLSEEIRKPQ